MPIRKVWRESRSRFFFILAALLLVTTATVFYNAKAGRVVVESKDMKLKAVTLFFDKTTGRLSKMIRDGLSPVGAKVA